MKNMNTIIAAHARFRRLSLIVRRIKYPAFSTAFQALKVAGFLLLLTCGCAVSSKHVAVDSRIDVPLPETTRFDHNPKARDSYLSGYYTGYRAAFKGNEGVWDFMNDDGDEIAAALESGLAAGLRAGREARMQQLRGQRLMEMQKIDGGEPASGGNR